MTLETASDIVIAVTYFVIPIQVLWFFIAARITKCESLAVAILFVTFITVCGMTHAFTAARQKQVTEIVKLLDAIVSAATALAMFWLVPLLLRWFQMLRNMHKNEHDIITFMSSIMQSRDIPEDELMTLIETTLRFIFRDETISVVQGNDIKHLRIARNWLAKIPERVLDDNITFFDQLPLLVIGVAKYRSFEDESR